VVYERPDEAGPIAMRQALYVKRDQCGRDRRAGFRGDFMQTTLTTGLPG
jgi:hypothetical protein